MPEFGPSPYHPEREQSSINYAEMMAEATQERTVDLDSAARREEAAPDLGRTALRAEATGDFTRPDEIGLSEATGVIGTKVDDGAIKQIDYGDEEAVARERQQGATRIDTVLTDYEDSVIGGAPKDRLADWHPQGQNDLGYQSTCGIACVKEVANQMGVSTSENELVHAAVDRNLCETGNENPSDNGGVTPEQQRELLASVGLDGKWVHGGSVDGLAKLVDDGHGVIARVDAGYLISGSDLEFIAAKAGFEPVRPEQSHHTVHVTGTVRQNGMLTGFVVNDPTDKPGQMVDVTVMEHGWQELGGRVLFVDRDQAH